MGVRDSRDDAEAKAAARIGGAVPAMERDDGAVEQPGLEPGTIVLDGERGPPVLRVRIDADGAAVRRVADGVVDQIVERLPSPRRIEAHAGVGDVCLDAHVVLGSDGLLRRHAALDHRLEPDILRGDRDVAIVRAGEHEQALGDADEMFGLLPGAHEGLLQPLAAASLGERRVDLRAQDRERRAQLVAGFVDEPALALSRCLEPVQGGVQRPGQPGERVVRPGYGQPPRGIGDRDLGRLAAHALDRPERRAGDEPGDDRRHQEGRWERDLELPDERAERLM
jgi:hypothetical protein